MAEFKGTKGKWNIFKQDEDIHIENECDSEAIATLVGWNDDHTGLANAKLIAAAPELLQALIEVVRISDRNHNAWNKAKEVIKKATE